MPRHQRRIFDLLVFVCIIVAGTLVAAPHAGVAQRKPEPARVQLDDAVLKIHFQGEVDTKVRATMLDWITRSARAVSVYYGRFPVPHLDVVINPTAGRGVRGGRAFGGKKPQIVITAGTGSTAEDYARDWIMVHEMIHMAFPLIDDRHDWMTEGLAVYVESVARLQAGHLSEAQVWKGFVDGMKNGTPRSGDKGLDHTPTWGRTYWGGTIFLLLADLDIRKRTNGKRTLQDALRAVLAAGGDHRTYWTLKKALEVADKATGTTVLMDLYEAWRATPVDPELDALWKRLGVKDAGKTVTFDDAAPLGEVRREIGSRRQS